MFDLGPEKILVVLVFAFVFFGPDRLPEIARSIGSALRTVRGLHDDVRSQVTSALNAGESTAASIGPGASRATDAGDDPAEGVSFI
jgi:TatA/E family protein of Tat protein translocase